MKMEAIPCTSWSEMCQGMGVLHCWLCATYSTYPWRLLYSELNIQKNSRIWHGNRLAQTAESKTKMEMPCNKCQDLLIRRLATNDCILELDLQSNMLLLLSVAIQDLSPHLVILAEAESFQSTIGINKTYQKSITISKGEIIQCYKELCCFYNAFVYIAPT